MLMAWLTTEAYATFCQGISRSSRNVTGSRELAAGRSPCVSPDGLMMSLFGPEVALVSHSVVPGKGEERTTLGTCGPSSDASLRSAALQSCLESRLRARLGVDGSPEYGLTWKRWDMESGPPICALRAAVRRTSGSGSTGWPSPMAGTPAQKGYNEAGNNDSSRRTVELVAGWTTPQAHDVSPRGSGQKEKHGTKHGCADLNRDAQMAGWPTPRVAESTEDSSTHRPSGCHKTQNLTTAAIGAMPSSSPALTGKRGVLNPRFSLWLMGYPEEWASCGERGIALSRKLRRSS